jgi:hypothetical protein
MLMVIWVVMANMDLVVEVLVLLLAHLLLLLLLAEAVVMVGLL